MCRIRTRKKENKSQRLNENAFFDRRRVAVAVVVVEEAGNGDLFVQQQSKVNEQINHCKQ